jgi:hypothetical protein
MVLGMRSLTLASLALVATGCATAAPPTFDAMRAAQTRTYPGVESKRVYAAAETLFRLADERDMQFSVAATGELRATRKWFVYAVLAAVAGESRWTVRALPEGDGVVVTVDVVTTSTGALFGPTQTHPPAGPAVYELFWARLDYLLGRSTTWVTCAEQSARAASADLESLCLFADDRVPTAEHRSAVR